MLVSLIGTGDAGFVPLDDMAVLWGSRHQTVARLVALIPTLTPTLALRQLFVRSLRA